MGGVMTSEAENFIRINQLKFIGKILSVYAHDLNNQLGIIKEASGLMEDIVALNKSKNNRLHEELARPLQSVNSRIGDAAFLTNTLKVFGRGMEGETSSLNINKTVGGLLVLVKRLAAQKRIELVTDFQADIPTINGDPLMLQFLLFCLMEEQLLRLKAKGRIVFRTARTGNVLSVMILPEGEVEHADENRTFPEEMAQLIAKAHGLSIVVNGCDSRVIFNV
jgi:nitrogen-specific signal transduction histidine kinase